MTQNEYDLQYSSYSPINETELSDEELEDLKDIEDEEQFEADRNEK